VLVCVSLCVCSGMWCSGKAILLFLKRLNIFCALFINRFASYYRCRKKFKKRFTKFTKKFELEPTKAKIANMVVSVISVLQCH
jgi:hypothetical protein